MVRLTLGLECVFCHRPVIAKGRAICTTCDGDYKPSPLRQWRGVHDVSIAALVEETGLSRRTVVRADAGERMSHDAAMTLAKHTGLPWRAFRPKEK